MSPQLLAAWAEALPAVADPEPTAGPRMEDAEESQIAVLDQAFTRKFGPHLETWPEEARRLYLRNVTNIHRNYHPQAVAS